MPPEQKCVLFLICIKYCALALSFEIVDVAVLWYVEQKWQIRYISALDTSRQSLLKRRYQLKGRLFFSWYFFVDRLLKCLDLKVYIFFHFGYIACSISNIP